MDKNNFSDTVQASILIHAPKADIPTVLRIVAQRIEQAGGFETVAIPGTHFSAGSSLIEGDNKAFASLTIVEESIAAQTWEAT
jgi:hypothetical protein